MEESVRIDLEVGQGTHCLFLSVQCILVREKKDRESLLSVKQNKQKDNLYGPIAQPVRAHA